MQKNKYLILAGAALLASFLIALGASFIPDGWFGLSFWCAIVSMAFLVYCVFCIIIHHAE